MTDAHQAINSHLNETSRRTTKAQHEGLDCLLTEISLYRASLRTQPDHGCARVDRLKNMSSLIGMLACADGRQTVIRETRQAVNVDGILAPSFDELVQQEQAEEREELVNDVLAAADTIVDLGLVPLDSESRKAVTELETSVHDLYRFDEELDESDDDDDDYEQQAEGISTIILPPALTIYERRELEEFFRSIGVV